MRIVFLAWRDTAHPQAGGSEVVIDQLASRLTERGHQVELLHGGPSGTHLYRSTRIGGNYSQYLRAPFSFFRRRRGVDVVIDVENGIPYFSPLWLSSAWSTTFIPSNGACSFLNRLPL